MQVRSYQPMDAPALAAIFRDAVRTTGALAYDARQVAIWAAFADSAEFARRLNEGLTLVADIEGAPAAFGQLHPADHVALLYTRPAHAGRGCATRIYAALEGSAAARGTACLNAHASRISRHFFLKMGFRVLEPELSDYGGVTFERYRMEKRLG